MYSNLYEVSHFLENQSAFSYTTIEVEDNKEGLLLFMKYFFDVLKTMSKLWPFTHVYTIDLTKLDKRLGIENQ